MQYTVSKTSLKRCVRLPERNNKHAVSSQQAQVFFFRTIRVSKLTSKPKSRAEPPGQWHAQPVYLPLISFPRGSRGDTWKLGDSFFCFPASSVAPEPHTHRIRLFAYVNCQAQNIPSCVSPLKTAVRTAVTLLPQTGSQFIP